jgi:hypothetical protein
MKNTVCANEITIHGIACLFGFMVVVMNYIHMLVLCNVISCSCEFLFLFLVGFPFFWTQRSLKVYEMKMLRRVQYFIRERL